MNINQFKNLVSDQGLSKNNRWEVRVYPPRALNSAANSLSLDVGNATINLPGLDLSNIPLLEINSANANVPNVNATFDLPTLGFTAVNNGTLIERINLYCAQAQIPEREIRNFGWREYGESRQLGIVQEHGKGVSLTYYCSENMKERFFFEQWQDLIFNPVTKRRSYYEDYISRIEIIKYNSSWSKQEAIYRLNEAYVTNIAAQTLVQEQGSVMRLDLNFKYRNYERIK